MTTRAPGARAGGPPGAILCDTFVAWLAVWTGVAHAVVFLGGNLHQLLTAEALGLSALALGGILWARRSRRTTAMASESVPTRSGDPAPPLAWRIAGVAAATVVAAVYARSQDTALLWAGTLIIAVVTGAVALRSTPRWQPPAGSRRLEAILYLLCAACTVLVLLAHHPDHDDAFYLNLAAYAADHPTAPLIAEDTLHGLHGVALALPVYRVHSIELVGATLAYLTGREVADFAHLLLPAFAAFLIPLALARLMRILAPTRWLLAVGFSLLFLLCSGESPYAFGTLTLTRLHQGKTLVLAVLLPLAAAYGIEFGLRPRPTTWLRLAAVQIAAVGCSASSLWLAPTVVGLSLVAGTAMPRSRREAISALRTLALGLCASSYVLLLGLWLRGATEEAFREAVVTLPSTRMPGDALTREAVRYVLWVSPMAFATVYVVLCAWSLATTTILRRFVAVFLLGFVALFWNPYAAEWTAAHITGAPTYWRVFWILPLPVLVGATLSAPVELLWRRAPAWAVVSLCLAIAAALFALPRQLALSTANDVWIGAPTWKLPPEPLHAAQTIVRHAPPDTWVLAPVEVSLWIPTLRHAPSTLVVRKQYFPLLAPHLGRAELERRAKLARLVSGVVIPPHAGELLADAIDTYPLQAICIDPTALDHAEVRSALERSPLEESDAQAQCILWVRAPRSSPAELGRS